MDDDDDEMDVEGEEFYSDEDDSDGLAGIDSDDDEFKAQPSLRRALQKRAQVHVAATPAAAAAAADSEGLRLTSRQRALAGTRPRHLAGSWTCVSLLIHRGWAKK